MITAWGGWKLFQELLHALQQISKKHDCNMANVSTSFILEKPTVAGVIIGTRLGISEHIEDNSKTFGLHLDSDDILMIQSVTKKSNDLFESIGDCGDEYR
jgi:aryl-alcohol dehydrogenase-like predicted oxidoreductase